jgi:hypothetical protein
MQNTYIEEYTFGNQLIKAMSENIVKKKELKSFIT